MASPYITSFGDASHTAGDSGIEIKGGPFGSFPGLVYIFANADRSGAADQLDINSWNDLTINVDFPATLNNTPGTTYVAVRHENLEWSNSFQFTLYGSAGLSLDEVLSAFVVRPVYAGYLDISGDPIRGWTGPGPLLPTGTGDADLDGQTFLGIQGPISITPFQQDQGLGQPITVTMAAGDMDDEELFQQLVVDQRIFQGRKAKFWQLFLTEDESAVLSNFQVLFDGIMTGAQTVRQPGSPATISVTCDVDLQWANIAPSRLVDHQMFNSGDTFSSFITDLARGPLTAGFNELRRTPRRGRGPFFRP